MELDISKRQSKEYNIEKVHQNLQKSRGVSLSKEEKKTLFDRLYQESTEIKVKKEQDKNRREAEFVERTRSRSKSAKKKKLTRNQAGKLVERLNRYQEEVDKKVEDMRKIKQLEKQLEEIEFGMKRKKKKKGHQSMYQVADENQPSDTNFLSKMQ